jgi:hypothetical protein
MAVVLLAWLLALQWDNIHGAIPTADSDIITNRLGSMETALKDAFTALEAKLDEPSRTCFDFDRACDSALGFGQAMNSSALVPDSAFGNTPVNRQRIMFKQAPTDTSFDATLQQEVCRVQDTLPNVWKTNLEGSEAIMGWQYYGGLNDVYGIYPSFDWAASAGNACPGTFRPTLRPW